MKKIFFSALLGLVLLGFSGCGAMNEKLHIPASKGDLGQIKQAINNGIDVNSLDIVGQTALMYASESGRLNVVKYLISKGADLNIKGNNKTLGTALIFATRTNRVSIVSYLLENGALINETTTNNESALHYASALGHSSIVKTLLNNKIDRNIKNKDGKTALDLAKDNSRSEIISIFNEVK